MTRSNDMFGAARTAYEDELADWYPEFAWEKGDGRSVETLRVQLTPTPPPDELEWILSDLDARAQVAIGERGQVRHASSCTRVHSKIGIGKLEPQAYAAVVELRPPPTYPRAWVVSPDISRRTFPDHPHMYPDGAACPFYPPDRTWTWANTPAQFLHQLAIWLLKTQVWIANGRWIGPDVGHRFGERPPLRRDDPCHCGSGKIYRHCHRAEDRIRERVYAQQLEALVGRSRRR